MRSPFKRKYDLGFFDGLEQALWFLNDEISYAKHKTYEGDVLENYYELLETHVEYLREKYGYEPA
jgi:hypothetical protein